MYGVNPYLNGPHAIALDPLFPYIGAKWFDIPSVYGPVFTAAQLRAGAAVDRRQRDRLQVARGARQRWLSSRWSGTPPAARGVDPVRAVALVGLNPLLVALRRRRRPQRPADAACRWSAAVYAILVLTVSGSAAA